MRRRKKGSLYTIERDHTVKNVNSVSIVGIYFFINFSNSKENLTEVSRQNFRDHRIQ